MPQQIDYAALAAQARQKPNPTTRPPATPVGGANAQSTQPYNWAEKALGPAWQSVKDTINPLNWPGAAAHVWDRVSSRQVLPRTGYDPEFAWAGVLDHTYGQPGGMQEQERQLAQQPSLLGDIVGGVVSRIPAAYQLAREGEYASAIGQALAGGVDVLGPVKGAKLVSQAARGAADITKLNRIPYALVSRAINPSTSLTRQFAGVDIPQVMIDHSVMTMGKAGQIKDAANEAVRTAAIPGTVDPSYTGRMIVDKVREQGGFEGRGAERAPSDAALKDINERYIDRWTSPEEVLPDNTVIPRRRIPQTYTDLNTERLAQGDLASWARNRMGETTASNVGDLHAQANYFAARDQMDNLATMAGMPEPSKHLTTSHQMLAVEQALDDAHKRRSLWGQHVVARPLAAALLSGAGTYGSTSNLPLALAAATVGGLMAHPNVGTGTGVWLAKGSRMASSPAAIKAALLTSMADRGNKSRPTPMASH